MNVDKLIEFAEKHGAKLKKEAKEKQNASDISTAAKQKELLLRIATDLGYLQ